MNKKKDSCIPIFDHLIQMFKKRGSKNPLTTKLRHFEAPPQDGVPTIDKEIHVYTGTRMGWLWLVGSVSRIDKFIGLFCKRVL